MTTHRASYELHFGSVPEGLVLDHTCHNRDESCPGGACVHHRCINPHHLEAVTQAENVHRSHKSPSALQARQTHCKNGHPFDEVNTYYSPAGSRVCRECRRRQRPPLEIANPCGYVSESGKSCTRVSGHDGRHNHDPRRAKLNPTTADGPDTATPTSQAGPDHQDL
ncbi:HNH endonuclease [Streptomyces sp. NPDC007164]|uniref:HNH endonuclease n=1 Tax=Streptomyces sp. NPDC007164 TaxID=3156918 RepID=UPI00340ED117